MEVSGWMLSVKNLAWGAAIAGTIFAVGALCYSTTINEAAVQDIGRNYSKKYESTEKKSSI